MRCLSAIRTNGLPELVEVYERMARKLPLQAVKAISRSPWNDSYRADSGPSRGDPWRQASRPTEASKAAARYVRNTSSKPVKLIEF
jgi:hypothetical protein